MKKILILLSSMLISFSSYAEWDIVSEGPDGSIYYIDTDSFKKHGGYVYYWLLNDRLKPGDLNMMSFKGYQQGDCGAKQVMVLSFTTYVEPMGRGEGFTITPPEKWAYQAPGTIGASVLDFVCASVNY